MDGTGLTLLLLVAVLIAFGVYLRRRYGNLYERLSEAVERATGLAMPTIVRGLGILTLLAWAAIFLIYGGDKEEGLDAIFQEFLPHLQQEAEEP